MKVVISTELFVQVIQGVLEEHLGKIQCDYSLADLKAKAARISGLVRERNVEIVQQAL